MAEHSRIKHVGIRDVYLAATVLLLTPDFTSLTQHSSNAESERKKPQLPGLMGLGTSL